VARITKGLLGGFSGKIGPVVGYTLYGVDRMRSLPERTAPPTENELKNRSQFKLVQDTLNPIKELLKVGFKNYWTVSGGTRAALSYNRKFAVKATEEGYDLDPEHFKISGGSLPGLTGLSVVQESGEVLRFHWNPEPVPGSSGYDQVMLLAIDLKGQESCYECPGNFRTAGTDVLRISEDLSGKEIDVYIGVVAKDRSCQSDSQYLGRILLQEGEAILNREMEPAIPDLKEEELMEEDKMIPIQKSMEQALITATKQTITAIKETHPNHHFYYFVLTTTGEALSPGHAAWSEELLETEAQKQAGERNENCDNVKGLIRYSYADSPLFCYGEAYFKEVERLFLQRPGIDERNEKDWETEFNLRINAMINALKALDEEGFFGNAKEKLFINVEVNPPDGSNEIRARLLNTDERVQEWLNNGGE
jgi:hypothetical protein